MRTRNLKKRPPGGGSAYGRLLHEQGNTTHRLIHVTYFDNLLHEQGNTTHRLIHVTYFDNLLHEQGNTTHRLIHVTYFEYLLHVQGNNTTCALIIFMNLILGLFIHEQCNATCRPIHHLCCGKCSCE